MVGGGHNSLVAAATWRAGFECDCSSGWHRLGPRLNDTGLRRCRGRCHATRTWSACCRRRIVADLGARWDWRGAISSLHPPQPRPGALALLIGPTGEPRAALHLAASAPRRMRTASPRSTGAAGAGDRTWPTLIEPLRARVRRPAATLWVRRTRRPLPGEAMVDGRSGMPSPARWPMTYYAG